VVARHQCCAARLGKSHAALTETNVSSWAEACSVLAAPGRLGAGCTADAVKRFDRHIGIGPDGKPPPRRPTAPRRPFYPLIARS
jgi:hypothetical protein